MQRDLDNNFKYFLNAARELSALIQPNAENSPQLCLKHAYVCALCGEVAE